MSGRTYSFSAYLISIAEMILAITAAGMLPHIVKMLIVVLAPNVRESLLLTIMGNVLIVVSFVAMWAMAFAFVIRVIFLSVMFSLSRYKSADQDLTSVSVDAAVPAELKAKRKRVELQQLDRALYENARLRRELAVYKGRPLVDDMKPEPVNISTLQRHHGSYEQPPTAA